MNGERCTVTRKPFDSLWHDDGNAFMCSECGTVTKRTRFDPCPKLLHEKRKPRKAKP